MIGPRSHELARPVLTDPADSAKLTKVFQSQWTTFCVLADEIKLAPVTAGARPGSAPG
jgi:hypothetical protein